MMNNNRRFTLNRFIGKITRLSEYSTLFLASVVVEKTSGQSVLEVFDQVRLKPGCYGH